MMEHLSDPLTLFHGDMAVFMVNICKYNGCGLTFPSLADLIQHIEDTHIDYDPRVIEQKEQQQPACLPLSYVLRFFTDAARKEALESKKKAIHSNANKTPPVGSVRSNTPTGSEKDEEEMMSDSEDSNDSWTTTEEFSTDFMIKYGNSVPVKKSPLFNKKTQPCSNNSSGASAEKPFACPVSGCKKRYKNVNGIKYHFKNGHKKDGKVRKAFKCPCGKSYKTSQGLKNHSATQHNGANIATLGGTGREVLQIPAGHVATLQPVRTLSLKPLTSANLSTLKTIQGLVMTSKSGEANTKSEGLDSFTFSKGTSLQMTLPKFVTPSQKGLVVAQPEQQTLTALGVLTPATSPQTPGPESAPSSKQVAFLSPSIAPGAVADVAI